MKSYKVSMIDRTGKTLTETVPAENEAALLNMVKSQGNYLLKYEEVSTITKSRSKLGLDKLVIFTYQMSAMMSAGVSIIDSLRMMQDKATKAEDKKIYRNLYEEVQKGNSLSVAMMEQGGAFDAMLISMVKSGESTGSLDETLKTMSNQYERDKKINQKLKTASIYPMVLFVVSVLVVLVLVTFVLPGIMNSFPEAETPFLTRILMGLSTFLITRWYVVLMIVAGVSAGFVGIMNNRKTRIRIDHLLLKLPVIGKLMATVYSARVARSFASLYGHGVNALEMIELTSSVIGNAYLEDKFDQVYVDVSRGGHLSDAIKHVGYFDSMLPAMISVGEETGDLEGILDKIADYFDQESEAALTRLVGLIEPIMIVWMGIVVGLIVISILQPMFKMYGNLG